MMPTAEADAFFDRAPIASLLRWNPLLPIGGGVALALALVLSAAYPAPAQETSGMAMSGMAGMSGTTPSSETASTVSCTAGNAGTTRAGLDLANTPYMIMGGNAGMNMNGATHPQQLGSTPPRPTGTTPDQRSPARWPKSC